MINSWRLLQLAFRAVSLLLVILILGSPALMAAPYFETVYATKSQVVETLFADSSVKELTLELSDEDVQNIETELGWEIPTKSISILISEDSNAQISYGFILDELGKHYPMTFVVKISDDLVIKDIVLMVYREHRGAAVRRRRFLRQFFGKTPSSSIGIDMDINGISGATISSYSISRGVKRALVTLKVIQSRL